MLVGWVGRPHTVHSARMAEVRLRIIPEHGYNEITPESMIVTVLPGLIDKIHKANIGFGRGMFSQLHYVVPPRYPKRGNVKAVNGFDPARFGESCSNEGFILIDGKVKCFEEVNNLLGVTCLNDNVVPINGIANPFTVA
jgi:hypothetical protein